MASILLAAGVFTRIMQNSGMLKAMAQTALAFVSFAMAKFTPIILGVLSMSLSRRCQTKSPQCVSPW
jgi:CitMHS family citrate-Mg2+:H+ or citrate-Ca2+:H+ symporter